MQAREGRRCGHRAAAFSLCVVVAFDRDLADAARNAGCALCRGVGPLVISPSTLRCLSVITALIGGNQGSPSCTALCAATVSNRHEVLRCTKQVEITPADPVFDPQRQISRKFFWCPERLISGKGSGLELVSK
jgi:hypothetical protein